MRKLILSLSIIGSLFISSCCKPGVQSKWCNAQVSFLDCGEKWLQGKLPGLLGEVTKVLEGESIDWKSKLDDLVVDGISVGVCAVKEYIKLNSTLVVKPTAGTATKVTALTVTNLAKTKALLKAVEYLQLRK